MPCKPTKYPSGIDAGACLQADSDAVILIPDVSPEVSADYTHLPQDDVIWCTGALEITMLDPADAIKRVTIRSLSGTVTITPSVGTVESSSLTTGW